MKPFLAAGALFLGMVLASRMLGAYVITPSVQAPVATYMECVDEPDPTPIDYSVHCNHTPPKHFNKMLVAAAAEFGVNPKALATTVYVESGCNPNAMGSNGDTGLTQILPSVWSAELRGIGIKNLKDPQQNLRAGAYILAKLAKSSQTAKEAVRRYNGSGRRAHGYAHKYAETYHQTWGERLKRVSAR